MTGLPVPYALHNDNAISIIIIACFCLIVILTSRYSKFLWRRIKSFFYGNRNNTTITETAKEVRFLIVLSLIDCLMLAFATFFFASQQQPSLLQAHTCHRLLLILFGIYVGYFIAKWGLYSLVNITLFDAKKNLQWSKQFLLLVAVEGLMFYPIILLQVYLDFDVEIAVIFYIFVLILNKTLSFYKGRQIFFYQKGAYLQNILYFCALEISPVLALCGLLTMVIDGLEIIF